MSMPGMNLAVAGAIAALVAAFSWVGDRRRAKRKNLNRVGFMPWTGIFFIALLVALVLLGLAGRAWLAG